MKKLFMLVALMFGLASCQNEPEDLNVVVGGEQDVMINVSLPDETRTGSADGFNLASLKNDNNYQFRYILEIYLDGGTDDQKYRDVKYSDETSISFPVRLAPGRAYSFAVWADVVEQVENAPGLYYNAESLKNISINESNWTAMDEKRDAFYGKASLGKNDPVAGMSTITLTRPFAKVRIISTDIDAVRNFDLDPTNVSVEYLSELYTSFDAVSGAAVGATTSNKIVTADYTTAKYGDFDTAEATLFADYIFVPANGTIQFAMTVNAAAGEINTASFTTPIPVEVNKVTTIKGDVLTEGGNVSVKIENELGEKETINMVNTANSLQETINKIEDGKSGNVKLGGNIDLGDIISIGTLFTRAGDGAGIVIPANKIVVLDLNGFTISQTKTQTTAYSMIQNLGTLTIKDSSTDNTGKLNYTDNGQGGNYVSNTIQNSGVLTIYGGTIENNSSATVASNGYPHPIDNSGTLVINGGTFTNNANYSSMRIWCTTDDDTIVTIDGGTFNGSIDFQTPNASANKGTLTIKRGTFNADTYTNCAVRLLGFGADVDEMNGYIRGGQFNGAIALKNWSGSELNSKVFDITGGTFTVDPSEFVNDDYTVVENNGLWTLGRKPNIVKIGDVGYTSLAKAVAAVEDGGTITLVADVEFDELSRQSSGGTWYEGLYYIGNKSFTVDLNGKTITQNGAVNDYLFLLKNDTNTANTINFKNGTLDAGTTALCALCTSTTSTAKITINLENVNLIGNNSKGAVAKIRGGAELNVKAGTKITGKDSYLGIENWNATVNVYEGAEIYMNGKTSYNGCLIGVGGNGVINVSGGYGKGVSGGLIAMTSGGTINVSGGEWIANNDGTFANDNKAVLVSQNNRYETGWACKSILNVTGGTFKGGYNCYGMGPGVEPDDAQINIKGGNFNADPASYVVAGYEAVEENGVYTVGKPKALADFEAAIAKGGNVTLSADITLLESVVIEGKNVVLDLNGKTVNAPLFSAFEVKSGAELTIKNGKVVAYESTVRAIGGKATIESGEYTSTGTALDSPATYRYSLDCREGGELIINGGTFKSNNGMINVGSTVTINGGKFENVVEKTMTRHFAYVSAPLTINDGEFYGKANASAGGCFFCGAAAGGNIQVNGGKFTSLWTSGSVNRIFEVYFGGTINVTGGMFNTNGGIATFVTANTDEATKVAYPYVAK